MISSVECSVAAHVAEIRLNRPLAGNAIDLALARDLYTAVEAARTDDDVRVLLLLGNGPRFCVGGDVGAMAAAPDRGRFLGELASAAHRAIAALDALEVPVICGVQGSVAGAGLGLALVSDLVVAERSTQFLTAYAGVGLTPDCGVSWFLPRVVGLRRALELSLTSLRLGAEAARDWGIVTRVVEDGEVTEAARSLARATSACAPRALGQTRRLLRTASNRTLTEHLLDEAEAIARSAAGLESHALVDTFTEHRSRKVPKRREEYPIE